MVEAGWFADRGSVIAIDRVPIFAQSRAHGWALRWPDAIVLHYTGMRDGPSAIDWLCNPASQVSCHYVVSESGDIIQLVPEERTGLACRPLLLGRRLPT